MGFQVVLSQILNELGGVADQAVKFWPELEFFGPVSLNHVTLERPGVEATSADLALGLLPVYLNSVSFHLKLEESFSTNFAFSLRSVRVLLIHVLAERGLQEILLADAALYASALVAE
eukprot:CAMPEP_0170496382 /NCGR_PEP_ID=MMETSP0208-20121228/21274_1 /TAXON_ID=197538 /ORGANISM="Strombidium inclinatum, Strain S3" /LENGTH=117 /DNA_ID=CAMNT_0010772903 /DNA_START=175 /DNA_END=528 /DNA_ORIENTATION=+